MVQQLEFNYPSIISFSKNIEEDHPTARRKTRSLAFSTSDKLTNSFCLVSENSTKIAHFKCY